MTRKICGCTTETCGCCEGIRILTPQSTINRPGLSALNYRVGTHGAFLETMKARLSTMTVDVPSADGQSTETYTPLRALTTRDAGDFSIALLDGWAIVADVLTFYQERIADEGFLRTAAERRSILELARLIGYALRPGVAATVYLGYTIDENQKTPAQIPAGARSQSIPGPGELPQSFETSDPLEARSDWNNLQVRLTRPQTEKTITEGTDRDPSSPRVYLKGIATNLKPNDPLLIDFGKAGQAPTPYRVQQLIPDAAKNCTQVLLQSWIPSAPKLTPIKALPVLDNIFKSLELAPSIPPPNALQLVRSPKTTFTANADVFPRLLTAMQPRISRTLYPALQNAAASASQPIKVYALRAKAGFFGNHLPRLPIYQTDDNGNVTITGYESPLDLNTAWPGFVAGLKPLTNLLLDAEYDKIQTNSWIMIDSVRATADGTLAIARFLSICTAKGTRSLTPDVKGNSARVTDLAIDPEWLSEMKDTEIRPMLSSAQVLADTVVYAQSEELALAEEPIQDDVCHGDTNWIELDSLFADLQSGRWAIVSGERADVKIPDPSDSTKQVSVPGIKASELVMLTDVIQDISTEDGEPSSKITNGKSDIQLPGEKRHTFIRFAKPLSYCYRRDTWIIYGNVVKATHGETRNETLGNGDGSQSLQSFVLKQPPLTFVPASNPTGVDSTLEVFVNNVQWHEVKTLAGRRPKDRDFITKTDDADKTTVIFGNGEQGARLPTGMANVTSIYRNGIGKPGNVKPEQISLLQTRPLGVKSVINPLAASGGADKENRDQARENAPLAVMSLDRLVSVQDYADFTRTFAGIGKAAARKLSDTKRQLVHVTIAGADDIPIDETSDLYRNLLIALRKFGDADLPVQVHLRELLVLVLSANVQLAADYQWEPVVKKIRATLLDVFGFQKRALGQPALLSEVISAIQNLEGVEYVDVDAFGGVPEKIAQTDGTRGLLSLDQIANFVQQIVVPALRVDANLADFEKATLRPAQLAIFTDAVPDTLILNQIK